ncbi:WG repeat-containing protein [Hymenobacter setariae]|uniref:WG repeat-containing protein n=1 Tax=Hymenobacter setariae TaxID=2594794 RepID=A0A558C1M2_9BACT|nr:WG repeat-containing protein [Hymenobacter setariae]TVT42693.1 WG repeat-containing protein [Hymenobacter setariae]
MKYCLLAALLPFCAHAQEDAPWTQFSVQAHGETRYGYRDANGRVRIPAKFNDLTNARTFRHIMAVSESMLSQDYYLLKNGRKVGRDSVFVFDFRFDCESEGKILFRDTRKDRVGFLNAQGKAVIPAIYNFALPFHNGLAVALIGAKRSCSDHSADTLNCEHLGWSGGQKVLLNERNEVLVNNLNTEPTGSGHLNWYSLKVNDPTPDTATTVTLGAVNGDRYTFTDYEKEFKVWLYNVFVPAVRRGDVAQVSALCFTDLAVARPFRGWPHFTPATFVAKYQHSVLGPRLGTLQRGAPGVAIFADDLNTFIFESRDFQPFLTDCGEHFREKYPIFNMVLTYPVQPANAPIDNQEHFTFIRTASGYRLFSMSL